MDNEETMDCVSAVDSEVTILDVLGVDLCRDAILDYVHIRDLVRSERVCRRWQRAVLDYLARHHNLTLSIHQRSRVFKHSHRTVMIKCDGTSPVHSVLQKLGPLIVSLYTNRSDIEFYEHIASYCPRLRQIVLKYISPNGTNISEQKLGRAFQHIELEKVKLVNSKISGKFLYLMNLRNLKTLSLILCQGLESRHLKAYASLLQNVTSLELTSPSSCAKLIIENVLILLNNMPKLESIYLSGTFEESEFVDYCRLLEPLKRIELRNNIIEDAFLEGIAKSCKNLEYFNVEVSTQSPCGRGLAALILRPCPGIVLCFRRIKSEEDLQSVLEILQPLNDRLELLGWKIVTLETLEEAFKLQRQYDTLQLRLAYPTARNAKCCPALKIVLNIARVMISDADDDWVDGNANDDDYE